MKQTFLFFIAIFAFLACTNKASRQQNSRTRADSISVAQQQIDNIFENDSIAIKYLMRLLAMKDSIEEKASAVSAAGESPPPLYKIYGSPDGMDFQNTDSILDALKVQWDIIVEKIEGTELMRLYAVIERNTK